MGTSLLAITRMGCEHVVPISCCPFCSYTMATSLNLLLPTWVAASSMDRYMYLQETCSSPTSSVLYSLSYFEHTLATMAHTHTDAGTHCFRPGMPDCTPCMAEAAYSMLMCSKCLMLQQQQRWWLHYMTPTAYIKLMLTCLECSRACSIHS